MNKPKYPNYISPYTIEIEVTNYCNASCIFCTNSDSSREKGFIDMNNLNHFLIKMNEIRKNNWFNIAIKKMIFPKIVLAGLGEPLLHPKIFDIIKLCKDLNYQVELVTNGLLLSPEVTQKLINLRLDSLAISLHSLNDDIYHSITGIKLERVLQNVIPSLEMLRESNVYTQIWRVKPTHNMKQETMFDQEKFEEFSNKFSFVKVLGPSEPWDRDGKNNSVCDFVNDDDDNKIWCHKIYFTYNISWEGRIVLCCNDYNRLSVNMGNVFYDEIDYSNEIREKILTSDNRPDICKKCRRWKDIEYDDIRTKYKL